MIDTHKLIDIEKIVHESRVKRIRSLPKFIIRLLGRVVWEKELNATNSKLYENKGMDFVNALLDEWKIDVTIIGKENIPAEGKFVFVSNHPLGGIDGLSALHLIHSFFPKVMSATNELFNYIPSLRPLIILVDVFGQNNKEMALKLNELFESDNQILIFPAGEVSRKIKGKVEDSPWQKTFLTKAIQHQRDIIPIYVEGHNSNLFYWVARIRKMLKIKLFIETALLPHEMMRQRFKPITLHVGEVIPYQTFTRDKTNNEWVSYVRQKVYSMQPEKKK